MTGSTTTDLPLFPFFNTASPFAPLTEADRATIDDPLTPVQLPTGQRAWLVTRHADVRQVLRHPGFSADFGRPNFPMLRAVSLGSDEDRQGGFIRMDGEEHSRLRRMLTAEFMIKNIRRIEPLIQETVDRALDDMYDAGPPADLVHSFALPVPSMVICHLLGVPYQDHGFFQARSHTLLDQSASAESVATAAQELRDYLRSLIEAKQRSTVDSEDLLSRLVNERVRTGELTVGELVGMALLLLIAGHETTANMIGLSTLLLLQHPGHLAALRADPTLAPGLVEELLRYLTIVRSGLPRLATEDIEVGGHLVRAGEGVIALLSLANRDDAVFGDPEDFVLDRQAHQHIAFGFGVHQCIGQPLARAELRIALVELARRFPDLRANAALADIPGRTTSVVYGLTELPVTW